MMQQTPEAERFKEQLGESLRRETMNARAVSIPRHSDIYARGGRDKSVYFIETGQVKVLLVSPKGQECLLAIRSAGDIFGELCLCGSGALLETVTTMTETTVKKIPCAQFFACLSRDALSEGFVRYLAGRIADQQQIIAKLVTVDSKPRLGQTLSDLAARWA